MFIAEAIGFVRLEMAVIAISAVNR